MNAHTQNMDHPLFPPTGPKDTGLQPAPAPTIAIDRLLAGGRELWIEHRGERYRLFLTRNGKLILTK